MLTLKQLINKEDKEMKERRKNETSGCYYIFYILTIIYIIISPVLAIPNYDSSNNSFIFSTIWLFFISTYFLYGYLYNVKENGKLCNIFAKYKFLPIDINQLLLAKTILLSKYIIMHILPAQTIVFIIKIIYIHINGGRFFSMSLFIPLIPGIVSWIIFFIIMYINHNIYKT